MRTLEYTTDLCIIGGGMSGLCCGIAAARKGLKTIIVQDRPVLGGNASSEIRMWICGAHGNDNRETGIIEEIILENFYQNKELKYALWDSVLYGKAMAEPNLKILLNSSCLDAVMDGNTIKSITAWQSNAETYHKVKAKYFADCSGDSILSTLTGAEYMYGREAKSDFDETIPPDIADKKTMGMSCLIQIRETDHKVKFTPPEWAYKYETDADLPYRNHTLDTNFWWIEIGGEWDCIHDTDKCRDELLKICYGVWDHVKNYGDHGADNWELEWIGFLPGKRESRRYIGKHIVTQNDVEKGGKFPDTVAYGGWTMDDHFPAGFYYTDGYPTIFHPAPSPWGIPLRAMISKNIDNLCFAGRNISVTHAALSSSRVMATCSVLGQALGTALAQAFNENKHISEIDIKKLQQTLLKDDCFIPDVKRKISDITMHAECSAEVVRNGNDRGEENCWIGKDGDYLEYNFNNDTNIKEIRIVFDSNLNREYQNMPCRYLLNETRFKMPDTLIKSYKIEGTDTDRNVKTITVENNRNRLNIHTVEWRVSKVRLTPISTYGSEEKRIFDFELF